jgi:hypothetical protein
MGLTAAVRGGSDVRGSGRDGSGAASTACWGETARSSLRGARGGAVAGAVAAAIEGRQWHELAAAVGSFFLHLRGAKGARRCSSAA